MFQSVDDDMQTSSRGNNEGGERGMEREREGGMDPQSGFNKQFHLILNLLIFSLNHY